MVERVEPEGVEQLSQYRAKVGAVVAIVLFIFKVLAVDKVVVLLKLTGGPGLMDQGAAVVVVPVLSTDMVAAVRVRLALNTQLLLAPLKL